MDGTSAIDWGAVFAAKDIPDILAVGLLAFIMGKFAELAGLKPKSVLALEMVVGLVAGTLIGLGFEQGPWTFGTGVGRRAMIFAIGGVIASQLAVLSPVGKLFGRVSVMSPEGKAEDAAPKDANPPPVAKT